MASTTGISWCDATTNFWLGCTRCGPGCDGCYAAAWAFNKWGIVFEPGGERRATKAAFKDPFTWHRAHDQRVLAAVSCDRQLWKSVTDGKRPPPRWIFCNSLSDFFDKEAPAELRERAWAVIKACYHLRWQIVTKRVGLVERYLPADWNDGKGYEHVGIIGTMVDQPEYDRDAEKLHALYRLGVKWTGISMEPQIGVIMPQFNRFPTDWIITGGESRQAVWERNADGVVVRKPHEPRPYHTEWADLLIEWCGAANIPVFIKQMGDRGFDRERPMKLSAGGKNPSEWPAHIRVQQMPRIYDNEPARTLL